MSAVDFKDRRVANGYQKISDGDEANTDTALKVVSSTDNKLGETNQNEVKTAIKGDQDAIITNILKEDGRATGKVPFSTKYQFFKMRGGVWLIILDFFVLLTMQVAGFAKQYYQQWWVVKPVAERSNWEFLQWITILTLSSHAISILRTIYITYIGFRFARMLHFRVNMSLIYASVNKFWDRVPLGRIINRVQTDAGCSEGLGDQTTRFFLCLANGFQQFMIVTWTSSQWLWCAIAVNMLLCYWIFGYFMKAQLEVQRVSQLIRNPINQMYNESLNGLTTIRVFNVQEKILDEFFGKMNKMRSLRLTNYGMEVWLELRYRLYSILITAPSFAAVLIVNPPVGLIALLLTNIMGLSGTVAGMLRQYQNLEKNFIYWERCSNYLDLNKEVGYTDVAKTEDNFKHKLPYIEKWNANASQKIFKTGNVEFKDFTVRYREELPEALKQINLLIESKTKVGIVGRTGAGKTTFISAIYKTFEKYEGRIEIDGKEISSIDLKTLRRNLTIIPQDPHLFEDSLRKNLDPLDEFSDEKIIGILQRLEIWDKFTCKKAVGKLESGLEYKIENNSKNLSQGEKQLLCMARALLHDNKVVLLDEATANIDVVTEAKIQKAIQENFQDATILLIAHRLNTVMFCDKVLVLDKGNVLEYGDKDTLMSDPTSVFGAMVGVDAQIKEYMK